MFPQHHPMRHCCLGFLNNSPCRVRQLACSNTMRMAGLIPPTKQKNECDPILRQQRLLQRNANGGTSRLLQVNDAEREQMRMRVWRAKSGGKGLLDRTRQLLSMPSSSLLIRTKLFLWYTCVNSVGACVPNKKCYTSIASQYPKKLHKANANFKAA